VASDRQFVQTTAVNGPAVWRLPPVIAVPADCSPERPAMGRRFCGTRPDATP